MRAWTSSSRGPTPAARPRGRAARSGGRGRRAATRARAAQGTNDGDLPLVELAPGRPEQEVRRDHPGGAVEAAAAGRIRTTTAPCRASGSGDGPSVPSARALTSSSPAPSSKRMVPRSVNVFSPVKVAWVSYDTREIPAGEPSAPTASTDTLLGRGAVCGG